MPKTWTNGLALLPDENGSVALQDGLGMVHAANDRTFAREAADALRASDSDGPDVLAVRTRLLARLSGGDVAAWRGLLAAVLLLDTWREACELRTIRVTHAASAFSGAVLDAARRDMLYLIVLRSEGHDAVLGLVDSEVGIVPAADMERLSLPARLPWYDRATGDFSDPCALLNQRDRRRLSARLRLLGTHPAVIAFANELSIICEKLNINVWELISLANRHPRAALYRGSYRSSGCLPARTRREPAADGAGPFRAHRHCASPAADLLLERRPLCAQQRRRAGRARLRSPRTGRFGRASFPACPPGGQQPPLSAGRDRPHRELPDGLVPAPVFCRSYAAGHLAQRGP